jgi:long-chain acyl-CoA synthetase
VGTILKGYEVQIRDREGNIVKDPKEEGILWLKGPSVFQGYFKDPERTAERIKDGWFNTGDIVKIDEDGYLSILDRESDIIIVGGFNVYPAEVEEVIRSIPGVLESAVVGVPHPISGEIVKAYVVKRPGAELQPREIISYCKERLAHYKVPRVVEFIDELPRSSIGKVLRRELRNR